MPDYVSTGGDWKQIPNPHASKKGDAERARKPKVFPSAAPKKEVSKEDIFEKPKVVLKAKTDVKPSKKSSAFTPVKKKGKQQH